MVLAPRSEKGPQGPVLPEPGSVFLQGMSSPISCPLYPQTVKAQETSVHWH